MWLDTSLVVWSAHRLEKFTLTRDCPCLAHLAVQGGGVGSRQCQVWGAGRVGGVGSLRSLSVGTRMEPWETLGSSSFPGLICNPRS